jgi:hypothetical protein
MTPEQRFYSRSAKIVVSAKPREPERSENRGE